MRHFVLPDESTFPRHAPLVSNERPSSSPVGLASQALEHGAYYAGYLGREPAVARWHSKKRRFVFSEFTLGRLCVRSVTHVAEGTTGERFIPLSKTEPKDANRVSDYAFETGG
jgi:hypothetical protein